MKAVVATVVAAFNQEKALVGAFSVIVQLHQLIEYSTNLFMLNIQVNATTGALKVFRNEDCLKCELGVGVYSFSCYNPFLRRKSAGKLRLALFSPCLLDKTFR